MRAKWRAATQLRAPLRCPASHLWWEHLCNRQLRYVLHIRLQSINISIIYRTCICLGAKHNRHQAQLRTSVWGNNCYADRQTPQFWHAERCFHWWEKVQHSKVSRAGNSFSILSLQLLAAFGLSFCNSLCYFIAFLKTRGLCHPSSVAQHLEQASGRYLWRSSLISLKWQRQRSSFTRRTPL